MKYFFVVFIVCLLLVMTLSTTVSTVPQQAASVDLSGYVWTPKTTLHALVVTAESESWWQPDLANSALSAIDQWNEAFQYFSTKYSAYNYLSKLSILGAVSNTALAGFDIYIAFTDERLVTGKDILGLTQINPCNNGTIKKSEITLATKSESYDLTGSDLQDIATHELGHALGLGHCNSTGDLMYRYYDLLSTDNAISTLDLYAVATCFSWSNPNNYVLKDSTLHTAKSLPLNVAYEYAPVPHPAPKTFDDNPLVKTVEIVVTKPPFLVMAVSTACFFVFVFLLYSDKLNYLKKIKNSR
jgi:predicted Zn-dependent protease